MLCRETAKCIDLVGCFDDGAILHIGEALQDFGALDSLWVAFTDLSTDRTTTIDAENDGDAIWVVPDGFEPITGHVYRVEVTWGKYGGGLFPVQVYPYEYTGGILDISTVLYDSLLVRFVKNNGVNGSGLTTSEQWLSLHI